MAIPSRVSERLASGLKQFQPVVRSAKARDVNEADTGVIVTDMLCYLFGYDKYSELTSEFAVRSTFCDVAIKVDGKVQTLIEVKAIGSELKDSHTRQAVDYAANEGVEWVVLTNAALWRVYKVVFSKPVDHELVVEMDIEALSHRNEEDLAKLYLLAKEGWAKSALDEFDGQRQALSRYSIAAVVLAEPTVRLIRRQLRRVSKDVKIDPEQIRQVLTTEVLKREVLEGDRAEEAKRRFSRAANRARRAKVAAAGSSSPSEPNSASGA
jgi:hypothetical protein